jgi:ferric-dicitrate binding protein FerR (iron transport regulator)
MTELDDNIRRWLELAGPRPAVSDERTRRVRATVHDAWRQALRQRTQQRVVFAGLTLAAAATVVLAVWLRVPARTPGAPAPTVAHVTATTGTLRTAAGVAILSGDPVPAGTMMQVGNEGLATIALADGAELRLDRGSIVTLDDTRSIRIERGAVYVAATTGGSGSIGIHTPVGIVRDVGTRFEVRLDDRVWRVRVREGRIRLERNGASRDADAGRELAVNPDGSLVERAVTPYDSVWAWTTRAAPVFEVEGAALSAFLAWVAAEDGRPVRFEDAALATAVANTRLHGSIDGLSPSEALAVVLPTCGLASRRDGEQVVVFRP